MTTIPADPAVEEIMACCDALIALAPAEDEAKAISRLQSLERVKSLVEAAQAKETAAFEQRRMQAEATRGVARNKQGKGLGAEVGLARSESPSRGAQHLALARDLTTDLPHTFAALQAGRIREEHADVVSRETRWLEASHRREIDLLLIDRLGSLGPRKLAAEVRAHAQRLDPAGAVKRLARSAEDRCVNIRPAPEGMARVNALLPLPQAVGVVATLRRDATTMVGTGQTEDHTGQTRTRQQLMADLFVERLTGQTAATAVPAEVAVVMTDATLFAGDDSPAWLQGYGPLPAAIARQWLADEEVLVFLRRLYTNPTGEHLVRLESRARFFPPALRKQIILRDDTCRTSYCEAQITEIDHLRPHRDGGPTTWDNGSGLCARCNQTKENIGWEHRGNADFLRITTPTGHHYTTTVPAVLPGQDLRAGPPPRLETGPIDVVQPVLLAA